ncbi:MAG: hypothetical protein HKN82_14480 [Akkermansiaceae bacterium]|nr:hypothetical protein [Akkermansiaceae bacterium]
MASRKAIQQEKRRLSATLASCRASIPHNRAGLVGRIHPLRSLRAAVGRSPLKVAGIACASAAILTLLIRRIFRPSSRRLMQSPSGPGLLFRWLLGVSQPLMKLWVLAKAKEHFLDSPKPGAPESLPHP